MTRKAGSRFSSLRFGIFGSLALLTAYLGCSSDNPAQTTGVGGAGPAVTGAGAGSTCQSGFPDGLCIADGPAAEDCTCEDCAIRAICNDGCINDGTCTADVDDSTEDCTCPDCYNIVDRDGARCSPRTNGCDDDPGCQTRESCLCGDCTSSPDCGECNNDGICTDYKESCACADCASECGSSGPGPGPGPGPGAGGGGNGSGGNGGNPSTGGAGGAPGGAGGTAGGGGN